MATMKSVMGGPGSGPRPGHKSPWYERGGTPESDTDGGVTPNPDASPLPEQYDLFFENLDKAVVVPIGDLDAQKPPESQPKSVQTAEDRMLEAADGKRGKRDSISVADTGDGRYKILDGNATYGAAMKSGWNGMPVMVEEEPAGEVGEASVFGGLGSGPKPGHKSPWYNRGARGALIKRLSRGRPTLKRSYRPGAPGGGLAGPVDEADLLRDFGEIEEEMNEKLRLGTAYDRSSDVGWTANALDGWLDRASIPEGITVWRGMDLDPSVAQAVVPGSQFQNPGFTSTTLIPPNNPASPVGGADLIVEISVPAGTAGAYVADYTRGAEEVLFPTGMNLRVDSRDGNVVRASVLQERIESGIRVPRGGLIFDDLLVEGFLSGHRSPWYVRGSKPVFGGPGSGPKPGHKSPWYERGRDLPPDYQRGDPIPGGPYEEPEPEKKAKKPRVVIETYKGYELTEVDNPPAEDKNLDSKDAAAAVRAAAAAQEVGITKAMIDIAEENNATMVGLDFRMKSEKSIARKAHDEQHVHGSPAGATGNMSDIVRYTMTYSPSDYTDGVTGTLADMESRGYETRVKNYWQQGDPYQGINVAMVSPEGQRFEMQFHTPESQEVKDGPVHPMYEVFRESVDNRQRRTIYAKMTVLSDRITIPDGVEDLMRIGSVKTQPLVLLAGFRMGV